MNRNITPKNIQLDCEGSLKRLGTDYIDVYQVRTYVRMLDTIQFIFE